MYNGMNTYKGLEKSVTIQILSDSFCGIHASDN